LPEQQQALTFMDPPQHRKYRRLSNMPSSSQMVLREPSMRAEATNIIGGVMHRGADASS